ncbi:Tubulin-specific chaperone E [Bagarius yarrelli]|uniref:Tubulin-specific chaperone E n=1 Tax=Bagarius yarrelli TaxID=175774 RepID=A0A556U0P2_BAGYA|nr:Tubulin-specific chaperone E [Bagarius yarrelli]
MGIEEQDQLRVMEQVPEDAVGRRMLCNGERATVRYVGTVPPTQGLWLGVEWDNPDRGKHDGSHEGVRYFTCSHPTGGSFVRAKGVNFGVDLLSAVKQQYEVELDQVNAEEIMISTKTVNKIGYESILEKQRPVDVLQGLKVLNLSNNNLMQETLLQISHLPRLETLNLSSTGLSVIEFSDALPGTKTSAFPALKVLFLDDNKITEWTVINELEKLSALEQLSCNRNPLMDLEKNCKTTRQLLIARISQLEILNKMVVLPKERRDAELDYCKKFGRAWLQAGGHRDPQLNRPSEEFTAQHPRYLTLIQKYGAPEEGELKEQKCFALKNQLWTITFECPDDPDRKPIQQKLPGSMMVRKVKGLLYGLLKIPGAALHLSYISPERAGIEIELDNDLKPLQFYSIEDGNSILVRWS